MATSRRMIPRVGLAALAAVALAAAGTSGAGPAAADPPGLVKTGFTSALNSLDKTVAATCPAGTVVSGGGGYLTAPAAAHQGHVALDRLEPLNNGSGFVAGMREVGAYAGNWRLSADALCLPAPTGWDVVSATAPVGTPVATVSCGTKSVIGVGGRINNGNGDVVLDYVVPSADLKSVTARGVRIAGLDPLNWSVTAFAVCAYAPGLQRVLFGSPAASPAHVSLNWSCPAGKGLYSVGAAVTPSSGQVFLDVVHAIDTDSFSAGASEDASYPPNWTLTGYGVCGT